MSDLHQLTSGAIYSLHSLSTHMLALAQAQQWEAFAEQEAERQALIKGDSSAEDKAHLSKDEQIILLKDIVKINRTLSTLAKEQYDQDKQAILGLKKSKKAQQYYQQP